MTDTVVERPEASAYAGKVAFITGAARGFGRAFADEIGRSGSVVLVDIDGTEAAAAAAELTDAGCRAISVECDVADERQVEDAVAEAVDVFGGIDLLVNNAGLHLSKYNQPFAALPRREVRSLFDVNVLGVVNCTLACVGSMRDRGGGNIVNISSIASYASTTPYGVSKLAVRGLTMAFATELAQAGIRCNAIAPGLIGTDSAVSDLPKELLGTLVHDKQLIPRLGTVDDVVSTLNFLCSDEASFITGETFKVSGGTPLSI